MSGPVRTEDVTGDAAVPAVAEAADAADAAEVVVLASREADVGGHRVRRALPQRLRRTVGAWCFADHMGPVDVTEESGLNIGPHPHTGLQTVTWLVAGEVLHRDSLGSEQLIRPGQLNLMTAGHGVSHAEERTGRYRGEAHGIQLWVAQPERTRHGPPAFEHHRALPQASFGAADASVLVGDLGGTASPARRDTDHVGVDLVLRPGRAVLPAEPGYEYGLVVLTGAVRVDGIVLTPGHLGYLGTGRDELALSFDDGSPARAVLLGGVPFESRVFMWWNFVARTREEVDVSYRDWQAGAERFGDTRSKLDRIGAPRPPWWTA